MVPKSLEDSFKSVQSYKYDDDDDPLPAPLKKYFLQEKLNHTIIPYTLRSALRKMFRWLFCTKFDFIENLIWIPETTGIPKIYITF